MPPIEYLPGARRDFDESFDWYAARRTRAAQRFVAAVDAALTSLANDPMRFVSPDGVHHEFPFRIVYRVVDDGVLIVAVAHAKRRPRYGRDRI